jgi:putative lipoic acid-binding regulatory protein
MADNAGKKEGPKQEELSASLIEFPCEFPLKIMGRTQPGFAQAVIDVVKKHAPDFDPATVEMRPSRENKYLSLTTTINAKSREQLDDLYKELCDHPMVALVL